MTPEEFITKIKEVVYESAIRGSLSLIQKPSGRNPPANLVALSQWFSGLSEADKKTVKTAITLAARQAVFGMLAVLDGVRQIENPSENGMLELRYVNNNEIRLLNDPNADSLHDLFNREAPSV